MKLPVIKQINSFIESKEAKVVAQSIELLEHISESRSIKDDELDVIGELISNMYGALEVHKMIDAGKPEKEALNEFMQRVLGSIDR